MQIKNSILKHYIGCLVLLTMITSLSFLYSYEQLAFATKDNEFDEIQSESQYSNCDAGEDNNNSCNNISISRQGDDSNGENDYGVDDNTDRTRTENPVQVSKQNSNCDAGEDNNNSCNNFDIQEMIKSKLKLISDTSHT